MGGSQSVSWKLDTTHEDKNTLYKKCDRCKKEILNISNIYVVGTQCDQCGKLFCKDCKECINIYWRDNNKIETICCMCKIPYDCYKL